MIFAKKTENMSWTDVLNLKAATFTESEHFFAGLANSVRALRAKRMAYDGQKSFLFLDVLFESGCHDKYFGHVFESFGQANMKKNNDFCIILCHVHRKRPAG